MRIETVAEKPILTNLQALRGIAALMVCSYHFSYLIQAPWGAIVFSHGWLGVQIFFIISGFIMVHTTAKIKTDHVKGARTFIINRIIRVVPIYYLCTFLMIAPNLNDGYLIEHGRRLICSLLFISPMNASIGPEYGMPSLVPGWSLNYEMLFYALFAISILTRNLKYTFLYSVFIAAIFVIPLLTTGKFPASYQTYVPYHFNYLNVLTNPVLVHFLFGITLGLVMPKISTTRNVKVIAMILATILFLAYITGLAGIPFHIWNDLLYCGLLVFAFLLNDYGNNGIRFKPVMVKIGDMSYSIYLLHTIVIIYLKIAMHKIGIGGLIPTTGFFLFAILVVIAVSYIFYLFVEKKLTQYLKSKFASQTKITTPS